MWKTDESSTKKCSLLFIHIQVKLGNPELKFNPPSSPMMKGSWKSLIKQVKQSLKSVTNYQVFTEEALVTILFGIKSMLNKHPLRN